MGEIGVGMQLGLNVFYVFDVFGIGDKVCVCVVFMDELVMYDVVDVFVVGCILIGVDFQQWFGNFYVVIYCVDVYCLLFEGVQEIGLVEFLMFM